MSLTSDDYANHNTKPSHTSWALLFISYLPGKSMSYVYDATGQKLRRIESTNTTDYVSGIQYTGTTATAPVIAFVQTEEGRVLNLTGTPNYEYSLTDHLGNSRVAFDSAGGAGSAKQKDDYYAFGMDISQNINGDKNEYLYNKKELQESLNQYDYGARFYDPVIGKWGGVDAFAEKYVGVSPYSYGGLNPLSNIDMNGDSLMMYKNGVYVTTVDNGKSEMTGYNQESKKDKDGNEIFTGGQSFSFNDIGLDENDIKSSKGKILDFMSQETVDKAVKQSGAPAQGVFSRLGFAWTQSTAGALDFKTQGPTLGATWLNYGKITIINGVAYNFDDAGNYLWGYAMGKMGFSVTGAMAAAQFNAWLDAKRVNGHQSNYSSGYGGWIGKATDATVRWFENRSWTGDAVADQRAIFRGLRDSGSLLKNLLKY